GQDLLVDVDRDGVLRVVAIFAVMVIAGPFAAPYDPTAADFFNRLAAPSFAHPLGTDQLGRDVLSRLLTGLWTTPVAAAAVVVIALAAGSAVGLVAAVVGGPVDIVIMRLTEALLTVPALAVALAIAGVLGINLVTVVVSLAVVHSGEYARLVRNIAIAEASATHVLAAKALGASPLRVAVRHILPGLTRPVLSVAAFSFSFAALSFAGLSFLGLGTPPGSAEWGAMIAEARSHMRAHPHLVLAPGLAIVATVLLANLVGDALGDRRARPSALLSPPVTRKDRL
ncbi:MAG: ABC transporter permease, partial [Pseudomonadota bacterium]